VIASFKRGAFASLKPIKILALDYRNNDAYLPNFDAGVPISSNFLLTICLWSFKLTVYEFETFYPDHL